ncbi:MAG: right-handed parallel beta-helix repeat-containing protein, partial [Planctomycetota bacterium]
MRAYTVVTFLGTDASTTLDGFIVDDGGSDGINMESRAWGGGIYIAQQGAATLRNLRIEDNDANVAGGGIAIRNGNPNQTTTIEDCVFENNNGGFGGALYFDSPVEIVGCTFRGNTAGERGGAVYNSGTSNDRSRIVDTEFRFNSVPDTGLVSQAGGAYVAANAAGDVEFFGCTFLGNEAPRDGAVLIESDGLHEFLRCGFYANRAFRDSPDAADSAAAIHFKLIANEIDGEVLIDTCCFSGNSAERGLGTVVSRRFNGSMQLYGSTLSRNTVDTGPTGGVYFGGGITQVDSSILWDNSSGDADPQQNNLAGSGTAFVRRSIVEDFFAGTATYPGTSNSDEDPTFVDADGSNNIPGDLDDNVQLMPGSPAIDAGANLAIDPRVTQDFFGAPRFVDDTGTPDTGFGDGVNPQVDIGAAEFQGTTPTDCTADANNDGSLDPADFNAWVLAFNAQAPECDQNGDGLCNPADFNAWVISFNAGC